MMRPPPACLTPSQRLIDALPTLLASEFSATYLTGSAPTTAQMTATLRSAFERDKAQLLAKRQIADRIGACVHAEGVDARTTGVQRRCSACIIASRINEK